MKSIEIKNLSFAYEKNKNILSSLNLKINKAEKIAITGSNGSGKSTFVNILMGFYEDYRGSIFVDNNKLNEKFKILAIKNFIRTTKTIFG